MLHVNLSLFNVLQSEHGGVERPNVKYQRHGNSYIKKV